MALQSYAENLYAGNGTIVVGGFCWGGSQIFRYATNADGLAAAMVFYGSPPSDESSYAGIFTPVYGF